MQFLHVGGWSRIQPLAVRGNPLVLLHQSLLDVLTNLVLSLQSQRHQPLVHGSVLLLQLLELLCLAEIPAQCCRDLGHHRGEIWTIFNDHYN